MAVDFSEKEREFLDNLSADTGRDLDGWMSAIASSGLSDRNAIIDWLREQGFLFAKASWLERIHHNGGRPIYVDAAAPRLPAAPVPPPPAMTPSLPVAAPPPPPASGPAAAPAVLLRAEEPVASVPLPPPATRPPAEPAAGTASVDQLLAEAKAYRPLAHFVLREIEKKAGGLQISAAEGYIVLAYETAFGALSLSPRELRLAVAFTGPAPEPFVKARFPKTHPVMPAHLTHMVVLTDARQITPELVAAVLLAAEQQSSRR